MTDPNTSPAHHDDAEDADLAQRTGEMERAATAIFRDALRSMLLLVAAVTILGVLVGVLVDGTAGLWSALLGSALTIIFSGTTVITMLKTVGSSPQMMAGIVLGAWVAKMVVLVAALAILGQFDFYNKYVFAAVLLVGVIGSVALDYRAVSRGRMPYVIPRQDR